MLWKEVKSWATQNGYKASKVDGGYSWLKVSNSEINGFEKSLSKLARALYNDMTDNRWIDHQINYQE